MRWLARLLGRPDKSSFVAINIYVRETGFDLVAQTEIPTTVRVEWEDIKRIEARMSEPPEAQVPTLVFHRYWGRNKITLERGDPGFADLSAAIQRSFPNISPTWEAELGAPLDAPAHIVLYEAE